MDSVTTFLSYNSTGLNSVKTRWIRDIINVTNSDFITLQEHFKKTKNIDKYFADENFLFCCWEFTKFTCLNFVYEFCEFL